MQYSYSTLYAFGLVTYLTTAPDLLAITLRNDPKPTHHDLMITYQKKAGTLVSWSDPSSPTFQRGSYGGLV